jgi:hypothetical protein
MFLSIQYQAVGAIKCESGCSGRIFVVSLIRPRAAFFILIVIKTRVRSECRLSTLTSLKLNGERGK